MTARKVVDLKRRETRQRRGGGRVRRESDLPGADSDSAELALADVIGDVPTPEFAAIMAEECRRLLEGLPGPNPRAVAMAKMQGYTNREIAEQLGLRADRRTRAPFDSPEVERGEAAVNGHPDPTDNSLPVEALERIDRICLEFESAWKTGKRPRIEDYLGDKQGAERGELLRQLLLLDLDYRRLKAGQPILEEYQARFPDDGKLVAGVFCKFSIRAAPPPLPGTKVRYFGDYELLEQVGHGGMGVVYKARQVSLNRIVALKMTLPGWLSDDTAVKRFRAEAEAAANLQHPNIVAVHEVGMHDGQPYFSMDYVEGQSLAEMVRENPLPAKRAAEYVRKIAEAVHYAHQQGTLRRIDPTAQARSPSSAGSTRWRRL